MLKQTQPITIRSGVVLENLANHSLLSMGQLEVAGAMVFRAKRFVGWQFKIGPDEYFAKAEDVVSVNDWP